jgi:hypothetical protein
MIYLTWFILSILCGMLASGKGKSFFGYFLLSTFLSPLIGFIAVLIAKEDLAKVEKKELDRGGKKRCPFCAELVKSEAIVCKHCSKDIGKECPQCKHHNVVNASVCVHCKKSLGEAKSKESPKDRCPKCFALQTKKDSEKGHCWKCDESLEK